jgi:hypothetical protein
MSRNIIIVLIYHRHKLLEPENRTLHFLPLLVKCFLFLLLISRNKQNKLIYCGVFAQSENGGGRETAVAR